MDASTIAGLAVAFLCGAVLLAVVTGLGDGGETKGREPGRRRAGGPPESPPAAAVDEALVERVRRHLETEQAVADEFVSHPSVESLYPEEREEEWKRRS